MNILFIQNVGKRVNSFSYVPIIVSKQLGYNFHIVSKWTGYNSDDEIKDDEKKYGIKIHSADIIRTPYNPKNLKAFKQICRIIQEEKIDVIHCNTPIGGVIGRLAGKKCNVKRVIYQAHGFHFYKGAPIVNWLIYYPIERILAHFTDALITINVEDFERAKTFHLRDHGEVYCVPGVGINTNDYELCGFDREGKRQSLSFKDDDILVVSAGDIIKRKNFKTAIKAISETKNDRIHDLICGSGPLRTDLEKYAAEIGVEKQIHFLGYRTDMKEILWASDIYLFTTYQEGLPRSLSEAMACGLPCVASKIRGNEDLIDNDDVGLLFPPNDVQGFSNAISKLSNDPELRKRMGILAQKRIMSFNIETVENKMREVYKNEFPSDVN